MGITKFPQTFSERDYKIDPPEVLERKIQALIQAMTAEEKFQMLGGTKEPEDKGKIGNAGYQWGVPRLGVPEVIMYDGPAGITGVVETTGLPQPSLLGCTWDDDLAYAFGKVAASECAVCSGNFLLAPQLDVIRSPHFYRNKDMKSEDSYQAARMGAQETKAVQENHVVAAVKHFAAANLFGDDLVHFPKQTVDEQTLHEVYCRPFEAAIRKGGAGSLMNAYNDVNGNFVSANRALLVDILREQWRFQGSVMSDWGSVHELTLDKGLDMEMPYPAFNSRERILKRLDDGRLTMGAVDEAVRHILRGMASAGLLGLVKLDEAGRVMEEAGRVQPIQMAWTYEQAVKDGLLARNAEIAANIVREGIVLLKNEDAALPLSLDADKKIVLTGLGAVYPICGEAQERSFGRLERMRSGQEALEEATGRTFPAYAGIDYAGEPIPETAFYQDADCTKHGLVRTFGILEADRDLLHAEKVLGGGGAAFEGGQQLDEDGNAVETGLDSYNADKEKAVNNDLLGKFCCVDEKIDFTCGTKTYQNGPHGNALSDGMSYTWKGWLKAPESGEYSLILQCIGGQSSFFIQAEDGWHMPGKSQMREWAQWPWESIVCTPEGMGITSQKIRMERGKAYPIILHARPCVKNKDLQLRLAWAAPSFTKTNYAAAISAAAEADTILHFACDASIDEKASDKRLTENRLTLSEEQDQLLADVIAAKRENAQLIVVMQTANARAIGAWADQADAILTTYMPGQEGNRILAEILTGQTNPSGKLSQTWPVNPQDTPLTDSPEHEAERLHGVRYDDTTLIRMTEGIFTGYRYYDRFGVDPLFPFGHGLSYTSFAYSDLEIEPVDASDDWGSTWTVRCRVTNTGPVAGD